MSSLHIITSEYPPIMGGVSEHSHVVAQAAVAEGTHLDGSQCHTVARCLRAPGTWRLFTGLHTKR
jgi:hypothetical protein